MNDPRRANRTWRDRLQAQLEPGAPPDVPTFARPSQPQPIPRANLASQVFSTYDALPTGARMFALEVEAGGVLGGGAITFTFNIDPQQGWITVLRELLLVPPSLVTLGTLDQPALDIPPIGATRFMLTRDGSIVPNVSVVEGSGFGQFADFGVPWGVYLVGGEQNTLGVVVQVNEDTVPAAWDELALSMIFRGEYLRARNLAVELETGHDAPVVRTVPFTGEGAP